jgi:antitoxin ParD1/3/4
LAGVPSFGTLALTVTKNTSVSLGDHFAEFIQEQVARGRFSSASDVVRAGLRLLEEREARLLTLQAALVEGERSGEPEPFDFDDFLTDKRRAATRGR